MTQYVARDIHTGIKSYQFEETSGKQMAASFDEQNMGSDDFTKQIL